MHEEITSAEVVLPCEDLDATLAFFCDTLGFRIDAVFPADAPRIAVVSGYGLRVRLDRAARGSAGELWLSLRNPSALSDKRELVAPNGTRVRIAPHDAATQLPPLAPSFVCSRRQDARWSTGRAGMRYRDLIPDRQGGRFVASHIEVAGAGPVPDYVHYHKVAFQLIYCYRGSARLVYEDQGPPFVLQAGDCVVQPPRIRHRVLESSGGLEVIEITSPAEHETLADYDLVLPNAELRPARTFDGQRFVHHIAAAAEWRRDASGELARDLGVAAATAGLASARVMRAAAAATATLRAHEAALLFRFVLDGSATLQIEGRAPLELEAGDAFVVPAGVRHRVAGSQGAELLEVSHPA